MKYSKNTDKPYLTILTVSFPAIDGKSEAWLENELNLTSHYYEEITIFSETIVEQITKLPSNCKYLSIEDYKNERLSLFEYASIFKIVFTDFIPLSKQGAFLNELKYNLSLIKSLYKKAKYINKSIHHPNSIIYAYWADNLATQACIAKMLNNKLTVISRAHGYEIYENLKKNHIIPFRQFQNKYIDKIFSVSKRGLMHLRSKSPDFFSKYELSYLGTNDYGVGPFNENTLFTIVTCCFLNTIKRIHLMASILQNIKHDLVWHILGDGPELENIKRSNSKLENNIKIVYHGNLTNEQVIEFYKTQQVNLFVSLSYSEGLPVSMMEAQSFGIPILATDVGGSSEICNEKSGILIPRDFEPELVAKEIENFKNSSKNTEDFRVRCREYWKNNFYSEVNYTKFSNYITSL